MSLTCYMTEPEPKEDWQQFGLLKSGDNWEDYRRCKWFFNVNSSLWIALWGFTMELLKHGALVHSDAPNEYEGGDLAWNPDFDLAKVINFNHTEEAT